MEHKSRKSLAALSKMILAAFHLLLNKNIYVFVWHLSLFLYFVDFFLF